MLTVVPSLEHRASANPGAGTRRTPSSRALDWSADLPPRLSVPSSANIWGPASPCCGHKAEGCTEILCRELSWIRNTAQGPKCDAVSSDQVLAPGYSCLIGKWWDNSMPSGKMEITIPQLWGWADWIRTFFLPVVGCVAWIRNFIFLNLRSPKSEMRLTMGLFSQGCCEEVWDILCLPW